MVNTEALRVYINSEITKIFPYAGYEILPDDIHFPYISWEIKWVSGTAGYAVGLIEADAWDKTTDAVELEKLCDALCKKLNKFSHIQPEFHISISFLRRTPLEDSNPDFRRRNLQFQIKYTGGC